MKTIALTLLLLMPVVGYGQDSTGKYSIKGELLSRANRIPFVFPSIVIKDNTTGRQKSKVIFDDFGRNGCYRFHVNNLPSGSYTMQISAQGFHLKDTTIIIEENSIKKLMLHVEAYCEHYDPIKARKDIFSGRPKLLLQSGNAPIVYGDQKDFEKKYNVQFEDMSCISSDQRDCIVSYNTIIFNHLDSAFGRRWRREIRHDVIGLK